MPRFTEKRALVTCSDRYMGNPIADALEAEGAAVIRDQNPLLDDAAAAELVEKSGEIDILIANFAEPPRGAPVDEIANDDWFTLFDQLVHPLMRIVRAVTPGMKSRGHGKIVAVTSAAPLRGLPNFSGYCAARGAQNAFVRAAGLELAPLNIQFNAIGQNYVENNVYYPPGAVQSEKMQKHVRLNVPTKKIANDNETAELAMYLASQNTTHLVGQVIPFAGGWTTST